MTEKAVIKIMDGKRKEQEIKVMFNPESYRLSEGASYSEKRILGLDGPVSQFVAGERTTLDMTLFFDTYEPQTPDKPEGGSSVAEKTKKISQLLQIDGELHRPPTVKFCWGKLQFYGYLANVRANYTMFLSDGTPVRAKLDVSFQSLLNPDDSKRLSPFESPDRTKARLLHEKEQLWQCAWEEYGDAERWREIAAENDIANPLWIEAGMLIRLPAL